MDIGAEDLIILIGKVVVMFWEQTFATDGVNTCRQAGVQTNSQRHERDRLLAGSEELKLLVRRSMRGGQRQGQLEGLRRVQAARGLR